MDKMKKVIIVGSGNAALCAGIAALEKGSEVVMIEKADIKEAGGNSRYTAGAMRFVYNSQEELIPLLQNPSDDRLGTTEFGNYTREKFAADLESFNEGRPLSLQQKILIDQSYNTLSWLSNHHVKFEPIYNRQSFQKNGQFIFWGGLTLAAHGEGPGLVDAELKEFTRLGGEIQYETEGLQLITEIRKVIGIKCRNPKGDMNLYADSVILACGGFEANADMRRKYLGEKWATAKVRGTRHNLGKGLEMALAIGAGFNGLATGCHAVPMDAHMPDYGNLGLPYIERKLYRKISYFLGIMLNAEGERFVDEGENFRNYTYAQLGAALLDQPGQTAWQIFDSKVENLLYSEYRFHDASFVEADTLENLIRKMEGIDAQRALSTILEYNEAVNVATPFDPTILDGKSTNGLTINKSNWANQLDAPPYRAFPVTCGITFTYGGLHIDKDAAVLDTDHERIEGLYACGELVGGVFYNGYPGGSGLTSGAVFGRIAGYSAAGGS